jgi:hypothetical protein
VQIIEPSHKALEITNAVAVGVHVSADGKAVDNSVFVPEIIDHGLIGAMGLTVSNC